MRWFAIALLMANVAVLGWAFNTRLQAPPPAPIAPATGPIAMQLLSELPALPPERVAAMPPEETAAPGVVDAAVPDTGAPGTTPPGEAEIVAAAESAPAEAAPAPAEPGSEAAADASAEVLPAVTEGSETAADTSAPTEIAGTEPAPADAAVAAIAPDAGSGPEAPVSPDAAAISAPEPPAEVLPPEPGTVPIDSTMICRRFGPFDKGPSADAFQRYLAEHGVAHHRHVGDGPVRTLFWVYLEPTSAEQARSTLADLERQGVQDYLLIKREDLTRAISLGVFSSQDSVNRRLAEMSDRGFQPVVVPRHEATRTHWIDVAAADVATIDAHAAAARVSAAATGIDCAQIAGAGR